jgi:hypothetical protein
MPILVFTKGQLGLLENTRAQKNTSNITTPHQ